jgi:hypothetical protein
MLIFVGRPVPKRNRHAVVAECTKSHVTLPDPGSQIGKGIIQFLYVSIYVEHNLLRHVGVGRASPAMASSPPGPSVLVYLENAVFCRSLFATWWAMIW